MSVLVVVAARVARTVLLALLLGGGLSLRRQLETSIRTGRRKWIL